jgi:23S rRNA G2445 N2-methylase RlmL
VYEFAKGCADWRQLLPRGQTLSVNAHLYSNTNVSHNFMVAARVRDAVCDAVREAT